MKSIALLVSLAFTGSLAAQTVCVTGIVEPAPPFSICITNATHQLRCSGLRLRSSTINLTQFEGQAVELCGTVSMVTCREMDVVAVNAAAPTLVIQGPTAGNVKLGGSVTLLFRSAQPAIWFAWVGTAPGWSPTPLGFFLLAPPFAYVASGPVGSAGSSSLPLTVPNDPFLIGADFHFQAGFLDLLSFTGALRNTDCFTVVP